MDFACMWSCTAAKAAFFSYATPCIFEEGYLCLSLHGQGKTFFSKSINVGNKMTRPTLIQGRVCVCWKWVERASAARRNSRALRDSVYVWIHSLEKLPIEGLQHGNGMQPIQWENVPWRHDSATITTLSHWDLHLKQLSFQRNSLLLFFFWEEIYL